MPAVPTGCGSRGALALFSASNKRERRFTWAELRRATNESPVVLDVGPPSSATLVRMGTSRRTGRAVDGSDAPGSADSEAAAVGEGERWGAVTEASALVASGTDTGARTTHTCAATATLSSATALRNRGQNGTVAWTSGEAEVEGSMTTGLGAVSRRQTKTDNATPEPFSCEWEFFRGFNVTKAPQGQMPRRGYGGLKRVHGFTHEGKRTAHLFSCPSGLSQTRTTRA